MNIPENILTSPVGPCWLTGLSFDDIADAGPGEKWARLRAPLKFKDKIGSIHTAPTGFDTDFASIPKFLWSIIGSPASGKYRRAAVLHDWLYSSGLLSRKEADELFFQAMITSKVSKAKARMLWLGVRVGGWKTWNKYRKEQQ